MITIIVICIRYLDPPPIGHSDFSENPMTAYNNYDINNVCFRSLVNPPERRDDDNITTWSACDN